MKIEPEPLFPKDFEEGVENDNYYKLSHPESVKGVFRRIHHELDNKSAQYMMANSTHRVLKSLSKQIYGFYLLPYDFSYVLLDLNISVDSQLTALATHNNKIFVEQICFAVPEEPGTIQIFNSECGNEFVVADKFIYVYDFPHHFSAKYDDAGVDVFAAILFGNKKIFSNNKPSMFHILYGWSAAHDLSTFMVDDIVGKLEQTGILSRWKKIATILRLLNSWTRIMEWEGFKSMLYFNTVQIAYDLSENLSLAEHIHQIVSGEGVLPTTNRTLATVWVTLLIGLFLSLVRFIWETVFYKCNSIPSFFEIVFCIRVISNHNRKPDEFLRFRAHLKLKMIFD
ncbi:unnamed protein product [Orchesella dallaii]|uniref:Uncharacterized protein n=1 Tax=Orchesella dallaii TaxID=48710 RepID=A0ABP1RGE9_9HEXA